MIVYHPLYDSYHCLIRVLKILKILTTKKHEIDRVRIYDYFFLFLNEIVKITLPHDFSKYKKLIVNNRYNAVQNSKHVFAQLMNVQDISLKAMASYGFINMEALENDMVLYANPVLPQDLLYELTLVEKEYIELLKYFETLTLKELKQRTKLMDHRYELS